MAIIDRTYGMDSLPGYSDQSVSDTVDYLKGLQDPDTGFVREPLLEALAPRPLTRDHVLRIRKGRTTYARMILRFFGTDLDRLADSCIEWHGDGSFYAGKDSHCDPRNAAEMVCEIAGEAAEPRGDLGGINGASYTYGLANHILTRLTPAGGTKLLRTASGSFTTTTATCGLSSEEE